MADAVAADAPTVPKPARPVHLPTPAQTVGPFLHIELPWPEGRYVVPEGTSGAVRIRGRVLDGAGEPVTDALVETWQANAAGRFAHPAHPRSAVEPTPAGFRGFGRCDTRADGCFEIITVKPGSLPAPGDGGRQAPHLDVIVFARGLLDRLITRCYFPDEPAANDADPVLTALPAGRRATLVALADDGWLRFDIRLQGPDETVFFDL
jgi:protocatechuate 3,4-dioxygenase alpha subunit